MLFFPISSLLTLLPSRPTEWGRFKWPVKWNPQGLAGVRSGFIIYRHLCPIMSLAPSVTMMMRCVYVGVCLRVCVCVCVCAVHEKKKLRSYLSIKISSSIMTSLTISNKKREHIPNLTSDMTYLFRSVQTPKYSAHGLISSSALLGGKEATPES